MEIMTPDHEEWSVFCTILCSVKYVNMNGLENEKEYGKFNCKGDHRYTREILSRYFPKVDIEKTLEFFKEYGGLCCDCEVLWNVEDTYYAAKEGRDSLE